LAKEYLRRFDRDEGELFVGKAQEKAKVIRTQRRRNPKTGKCYAWLYGSTSMVNHLYFYCVDLTQLSTSLTFKGSSGSTPARGGMLGAGLERERRAALARCTPARRDGSAGRHHGPTV
jgi:hypothetical protein